MDKKVIFDLEFHHLGLATKKPDVSKKIVVSLGYSVSSEVIDILQNVRAVICRKEGNPAIEILYPYESPGPVDSILKSQTAAIYHVCYQCKDIEETVEAMKKDGLRLLGLSPPKPAILFNNRLIAFYMVDGFGIVELLEAGK